MSVMQPPDPDSRLPRLYVEAPLTAGASIALTSEQTHYLKTVLRRPEDAPLRVFNGMDGEWVGKISYTGKKDSTLQLERQTRTQRPRALRLHLVFAPIKKDRMDFMIEKAVELGVTDLHPALTQYTTIRDLNDERMQRQIIEAAEQSERLDIPNLHPLVPLKEFVVQWSSATTIFAALEREEALFIGKVASIPSECGIVIGPEGGFSPDDRQILQGKSWIQPVNLGDQILRAETAAIFSLSVLAANFTK